MIQLYFKGNYSNSCSEVPDGTMITVQSNTYDARYSALKGMGCSHGAASFAANSKWETAQERDKRLANQSNQSQQSAAKNETAESQEAPSTFSDGLDECSGGEDDTALKAVYLEIKKPEVIKELAQIAKRREKIASDTSLSATERLKETLNCIVKAYHSQNSVIVDYDSQSDLERKTISEIKQVIRQFPIPTEGDELTDFIKYVKSGAVKPKKKRKGIFDILDIILSGSGGDDDNYSMENEDKIIGNLLYQKLWEIAEVKPEHPLIAPMIKKEQFKKRAKLECIGIILVAVLSIVWWYPFFLGLGVSVAGWLANEFAEVDEKYPIKIQSLKLPTHLLATIGLNIILTIIITIVD